MSVAGLSLAVVEDKITERFKTFIKDPQISVFVEEFKGRKVYIFGRVKEPGTITYEAGMSIIEVITRAGSFTTSQMLMQRASPASLMAQSKSSSCH